MTDWIEPVVNRTMGDVEEVASLIQRIQTDGWDSLSENERSDFFADMIGTLNHICLNRIENNTEYMYNYSRTLGFKLLEDVYKTNWTYTDLPTQANFNKILNNIIHLMYDIYPISTELPINLDVPTYEQINAVEEVLLELKDMFETIPKSYKYCGTFACGQSPVLPRGVDL